MLTKSTVLVLGAGSSAEFGLPAGDKLARDIESRTNFSFRYGGEMISGDQELYETLRTRYPEQNHVFRAGRTISKGLPFSRSIDDFLYNHGNDNCIVHVGKAAIVQSILAAEKGCGLIGLLEHDEEDRRRTLQSLSESWLHKLFAFLVTDVRKSDVSRIFEGLKIINFNYDRCVELFLFHALQQAYALSDSNAADVMKTLNISHPYGQPSLLPWQAVSGAVEFGSTLRGAQLLAATERVKTYTEQAHDEEDKERWRMHIAECDQIVFLGFAFHRQNVELLKTTEQGTLRPAILATSYGVSGSDEDVFRERIGTAFWPMGQGKSDALGPMVKFVEGKCSKLIAEHGLSIAG